MIKLVSLIINIKYLFVTNTTAENAETEDDCFISSNILYNRYFVTSDSMLDAYKRLKSTVLINRGETMTWLSPLPFSFSLERVRLNQFNCNQDAIKKLQFV